MVAASVLRTDVVDFDGDDTGVIVDVESGSFVFDDFFAVLGPGDDDVFRQVFDFGVESAATDSVFGSETFSEVEDGVFGHGHWWSWWWWGWQDLEDGGGESTRVVQGKSTRIIPSWTINPQRPHITIRNHLNSSLKLFIFQSNLSTISSIPMSKTRLIIIQPSHLRLLEVILMRWNNNSLKLDISLSMLDVEQVFQALLELDGVEAVNGESAGGDTVGTFDAVGSDVVVGDSSEDDASGSALIDDFDVFADPFLSDFFLLAGNVAPFVPFNLSNRLSKGNSHNAIFTLRNILIVQSFKEVSRSDTVDHKIGIGVDSVAVNVDDFDTFEIKVVDHQFSDGADGDDVPFAIGQDLFFGIVAEEPFDFPGWVFELNFEVSSATGVAPIILQPSDEWFSLFSFNSFSFSSSSFGSQSFSFSVHGGLSFDDIGIVGFATSNKATLQ